MKKVLILVYVMFMIPTWTIAEEKIGMEYCNVGQEPVEIAIGRAKAIKNDVEYINENNYFFAELFIENRGWFSLRPGQCEVLIKEPIQKYFYYHHIKGMEKPKDKKYLKFRIPITFEEGKIYQSKYKNTGIVSIIGISRLAIILAANSDVTHNVDTVEFDYHENEMSNSGRGGWEEKFGYDISFYKYKNPPKTFKIGVSKEYWEK